MPSRFPDRRLSWVPPGYALYPPVQVAVVQMDRAHTRRNPAENDGPETGSMGGCGREIHVVILHPRFLHPRTTRGGTARLCLCPCRALRNQLAGCHCSDKGAKRPRTGRWRTGCRYNAPCTEEPVRSLLAEPGPLAGQMNPAAWARFRATERGKQVRVAPIDLRAGDMCAALPSMA